MGVGGGGPGLVDLVDEPPAWAQSRKLNGVTELAVLAPIKRGLVPGEQRSYEERLRAVLANLARRHAQGIPIELDRVSTIHFGRMIVLRPEQFQAQAGDRRAARTTGRSVVEFDDYTEAAGLNSRIDGGDERSSATPPAMLLTLVEFDGELKPYMREIAQFMGGEFDFIFENCEAFPGTSDFELFWMWIKAFQIHTDLFYCPYPDISVVRIKQLELFKRRFDDFVARVRSPMGERLGSMDELFDDFLRAEQQQALGFPYAAGTYANGNKF